MGTLTGTQIENEIRSNLGGRTDLDTRLFRFANLAQNWICRARAFSELETSTDLTTTASTKTLSLPSTPRDVYSCTLKDGTHSRKLIYVPPRRWDKIIPRPESYTEGRPSHYTVWNNVMELYRVPDDAYTITCRYAARPTDFTDGSSSTSDYVDKDEIIIAYATSYAFQSLGAESKAVKWLARARTLLNEAILFDKPRADHAIAGEIPSYSSGQYHKDPFVKEMP